MTSIAKPDLRVVLPESSSHIDHLLPLVANAVYAIAPERLDALKEACRDATLEFLDHGGFRCLYRPDGKAIVVSTGVVEICWAASHAYFVLYSQVVAGKKEDTPRQVDLTLNPDVKAAMDLLAWAYRRFLDSQSEPWPAGLVRPIPSPQKGSPENIADELALCVIAFLIHHELAHHRLGHQGVGPDASSDDRAWSIEQERDADYEAAGWILDRIEPTDAAFTKRALGVAIGLGVLTAYGIHTGDHGGLQHPRSFDRLMNTLDRHLDDEYHVVWAMVVSIVNLHLNSVGVTPPPVVHESFRSCVDSYIEILAAEEGP